MFTDNIPPANLRLQISMKHLYICLLALFLSSCATVERNPADKFKQVIDQQGFVTVYLYRPYNHVGRARTYTVHINGVPAVELPNESYATLYLKPGKYEFLIKGNFLSNTEDIRNTMEFSLGKQQFVKFDRSYTQYMGTTYGGYATPSFKIDYERFIQIAPETALSEISQCYKIYNNGQTTVSISQ